MRYLYAMAVAVTAVCSLAQDLTPPRVVLSQPVIPGLRTVKSSGQPPRRVLLAGALPPIALGQSTPTTFNCVVPFLRVPIPDNPQSVITVVPVPKD